MDLPGNRSCVIPSSTDAGIAPGRVELRSRSGAVTMYYCRPAEVALDSRRSTATVLLLVLLLVHAHLHVTLHLRPQRSRPVSKA